MSKNNKGFSLIEVLVTLVLTAVGVLGMFVLQSKSISYTQDTVHREAAISAANELVEIMRVYRDELFESIPVSNVSSAEVKGSYGEFYARLKNSTPLYKDGAATFTKADCPTSGAAQQAKAVAGCWLKNQQDVLPNFQVTTLCPSATATCTSEFKGSSLLVALSWNSRDKSCGQDGTSETCVYSVRVEL
ncbi:MAG: type IV pilus modification protein PilV [Gammaproteobacteria bacterium]|nr:type IV pilus modification protein PilV [Gammaproteobacteria bacterium]